MRKPKKYYESISKECILNLNRGGLSQAEIAQTLDISKYFCRKLFKKFNIPISNRRTKPHLDKDLLILEHHINRLTLKEIQDKYSRSKSSLRNTFQKYDIKVIDNVVEKNKRNREQKFENLDLDAVYGNLTKFEIQKKYNIGQYYLDQKFEEDEIENKFFNQSAQEREVIFYLNERGITNIKPNSRDVINGEIDIYLPDFDLGIEMHGLYWHSETSKRNIPKKYHLNKANSAKENNVTLLQFFEDEWQNKKDICKSIICSQINLCDSIFARKCKIKVFEQKKNKEIRNFIDENHLQGNTTASVYLALLFENEIVCAMSFRKPRFGKSSLNDWEIIRFCNKKFVRVTGGASKLFSFFLKNFDVNIITSYADRRISEGKLYKNLGFDMIKETEPNYFYIINKKRSSRMNWQKSKLKNKLSVYDSSLTEVENMRINGYFRIFDAGNYLFKRYLR